MIRWPRPAWGQCVHSQTPGSFRKNTRCRRVAAGAHGVSKNLTLNWFTVDGGGGTSTGGVYSVSGTIGQPDAGQMSRGNFTLTGGFWNVTAAVQTPGAPLLLCWEQRQFERWP
ncbi:MAG: hypothetical protein NT154_21275 [Verrucomicrobia bacterium]|nr:hypothetical protein [Verrucomicrobiota bacterium]